MARFKYTGDKRREVVFPVGGIGSGLIGLDGTGRLRDWEIFNRPNKGSINGFSHFGIKVEKYSETGGDNSPLDARIMNADLLPGYVGQLLPNTMYNGYGFGPSRYLLSGVPHFRDCVFEGDFPFATVRFQDDTFPGEVSLSAFNPFIPGNEDDSSLPCAFYTAHVTNTCAAPLEYTFELSVNNPGKFTHHDDMIQNDAFTGVLLTDDNPDESAMEKGELLFATPTCENTAVQQYWYRGNWFDNLGVFWQDFTAPGHIKNRVYDGTDGFHKVREDVGTIAVSCRVLPGETFTQKFIIAWYYPNCKNYWSDRPCNTDDAAVKLNETWKTFYATRFTGAADVAKYAFDKWDELEAETRLFQDALYSSDLPEAALDAVASNMAIIKSSTCLRLTNGELYGFEGVHANCGSCEGSCTHVWNYAFAFPYLFPKLERSLRELDFTYNQGEDGGMAFRLQLPLGRERSKFRPCVDGQMGGIIKTYREWKVLGDTEWLKKWWPKVKKSLEYAWAPTNADRWDPDKSGVITGRQHHTLDMELFGPNAWLNNFYLGALKAASEMAAAVGDTEFAALCGELYAKGRKYTEDKLFNGEYFQQEIDIRDKSILAPYASGSTLTGGSTVDTYWSDEAQQLKYQIGEGCSIDQVLAQWMCELSGVGEILDRAKVDSALKAIYDHNFKPSLRYHFNPCRIYGLNDESALVICEWPQGKEKPVVPVPYAEEAMNGFEYQAAVHMILHGMENEGMDVVKGVRDRYSGDRRNPYSEMECGSNYARSMASYALLLAYSGFDCDMTRRHIGFNPLHGKGRFFWSIEGAWGVFEARKGACELRVLHGSVALSSLGIPGAKSAAHATAAGKTIAFSVNGNELRFDGGVCLNAGDVLHISDK